MSYSTLDRGQKVMIKDGPRKGFIGKIIGYAVNAIAVEFPDKIEGGHDCIDGKKGRCYYFDDNNLVEL